jgi:hypothetical protein
MFFCFCPHIFVIFPKAAYVSSLTSFNRKMQKSNTCHVKANAENIWNMYLSIH